MRIHELFAAVLDLPEQEITDDTAPHNTGQWTSRVHIQLVVALEDVYGITLSAAEIKALTSIGAAHGILTAKGVDAR
ncbi:acyl carrier protein [Kitasatospora sp. NBC_00374]|uniref:acyl carrier protein n=1 Tax=Kitasatospora sp. NBC_00374 TaxID=2975964 RepID=UPI0030DFF54F